MSTIERALGWMRQRRWYRLRESEKVLRILDQCYLQAVAEGDAWEMRRLGLLRRAALATRDGMYHRAELLIAEVQEQDDARMVWGR